MAEVSAVTGSGIGRRIESGSWVATWGRERGLMCEFSPAAPGRASAMAGLAADPAAGTSGAQRAGRLEAGVCVLFDGLLYNREQLARWLDLPPETGEIDVLWAGCRRWGREMLPRLEGVFALLLWDAATGGFLAATDPLASVPLYWAEIGDDLVLSPSLGEVVAQPCVPATVDRVVLAERLQHKFHSAAETCYSAVRSLLPGHLLDPGRRSWRAVPYARPRLAEELAELTRDELLRRFDALFEQAVRRCLGSGSAAVLLSGGLDSVAIAEAAVEVARQEGLTPPIALSICPGNGAAASERVVQEGVARQLGVDHTLIDPQAGGRNLVLDGLERSRRSPFPVLNIWSGTLWHLLRRGADRGCGVVLWGAGGDEWLGLNFSLAADLLLGRRWRTLALLRRTMERSYGMSPKRSLRAVIWSDGLRLLLREALIHGGALIPGAMERLRRRRAARKLPQWLADDRHLREALCARAADRILRLETGSFHRRDRMQTLMRPLAALLRRQEFHLTSLLGMRSLEPFWDRPLVEFLAAVPPELLMDRGLSKAPLRQRLATRFPELGLAGQKKYSYQEYVYGRLRRESRRLGLAARGTPALAEVGVVKDATMRNWLGRIQEDRGSNQVHYLWTVCSTEAWLSERSQVPTRDKKRSQCT